MASLGVLAMEHIAVGIVEGHRLAGPILSFPDEGPSPGRLQSMPADEIAAAIRAKIDDAVAGSGPVEAVGVGFPGIIRGGVVEESPNLPQTKGYNLRTALADALRGRVPADAVLILNDADAIAAGIAATYGRLAALVRVWMLGSGVGFGRYPRADGGIGEAGHMVVSLDPKETYCGCGGVGHLEGIAGHRSMRLRFLDREPEEIFADAETGDAKCAAFVKLWHRAIAAATATSVHLDGPGRFFLTGPNARFVNLDMLDGLLHEMIKMSPLQGSAFDVVATSDDIAIVGAAVSALALRKG